MAGLLGQEPSRNYKIYRREFPAIFRFNGILFQEFFDIDRNEHYWHEIDELSASHWLQAKEADMTKHKEPQNWITDKLKTEREERNIPVAELASQIGVDSSLLRKWENGSSRPSIDNTILWSVALGYHLALTNGEVITS